MFRKIVSLFFLLPIVFVSCDKQQEKMTLSLFHKLEVADSLLRNNENDSAKILINEILEQKLAVRDFSLSQKIRYLITSDLTVEKEKQYIDYLFSYCAQLEAIDLMKRTITDIEKQLDADKYLFVLAPDLYEVSQGFVNLILSNISHRSLFNNDFYEDINKYNSYLRSNNKIVIPFEKNELVSYVFREKWNRISRFLMSHDSIYGYEETFNYFDSILINNGAAAEPYLKSLVKSYMSFSGNPKYEYNTNMTYPDFKKICENKGDWLVNNVQHSLFRFLDSSLNLDVEGIIMKIGNLDWYYSELIEPDFYYSDEITMTCVSKNGDLLKKTFQKGRFPWYNCHTINVEKAILQSLVYHHNLQFDSESRSVQYMQKDTLVRRGLCKEGCLEQTKYGLVSSSYRLLEKSFYSFEGKPIADGAGIQSYSFIYSDDKLAEELFMRNDDNYPEEMVTKIIHHHFDEGKEEIYHNHIGLVLKRIVERGDSTIIFDSEGRVINQRVGEIKTDFSYTDSTITSFEHDLENHTGKKTIKHLGYFAMEYPLTHLSKEIEYYKENNYVSVVVSVERYFADNSRYSGCQGWAIERHVYDDIDLRTQTLFFDNENKFRGGYLYEYRDNLIIRHIFNEKSEETSMEELHEDNINAIPWIK